MKTEKEVMDKIKWDPSLRKSEFTVGYEDRFKGEKEVPLNKWDERVPLHRIRYFKRRGELVWHRAEKIDEL